MDPWAEVACQVEGNHTNSGVAVLARGNVLVVDPSAVLPQLHRAHLAGPCVGEVDTALVHVEDRREGVVQEVVDHGDCTVYVEVRKDGKVRGVVGDT